MALGVIYYSLNYCRGQQGEAVRAFVAKPEDLEPQYCPGADYSKTDFRGIEQISLLRKSGC